MPDERFKPSYFVTGQGTLTIAKPSLEKGRRLSRENINFTQDAVVQELLAYRCTQVTQAAGGSWTKDEDADLFLRQNPFAFLMAASIDRGRWRNPSGRFRTCFMKSSGI